MIFAKRADCDTHIILSSKNNAVFGFRKRVSALFSNQIAKLDECQESIKLK